MKGHLLKTHTALLKKSKSTTHASRAVLDRLDDYESKGMITSDQAASFRRTLNEKSYSPLYIQRIHKDLDRCLTDTSSSSGKTTLSQKTVASGKTVLTKKSSEKPLQSPTASQAASDISTKTSSTSSLQWHSILLTNSNRGAKKLGTSKHISWGDQAESTGLSNPKSAGIASTTAAKVIADKENEIMETASMSVSMKQRTNEHKNGKRLILDLSEMKISAYNKPFNEKETKQLFVEMCFYARLGFTQPPSCLSCSYRESVKESAPLLDCPRWTVWRHNANQLLHPCYLENNLVVVQCQAARRLLAGETIEGCRWNAEEAILERFENEFAN